MYLLKRPWKLKFYYFFLSAGAIWYSKVSGKNISFLLNQNLTPFWNLNPKLVNMLSIFFLVPKTSLLKLKINHFKAVLGHFYQN